LVSQVVKITASQHVYSALREQILQFQLPPGARLIEARLAEEFAVSATPVREALHRLVHDGLADRETDKGVVVHTTTPDEVSDYFEMRIALEPLALRQTVTRGDADLLPRLDRILVQAAPHIESGGVARLLDLGGQFTELLTSGVTNKLMADALSLIRDKRILYSNYFRAIRYLSPHDWADRRNIISLISASRAEEAAAVHVASIERVAAIGVSLLDQQYEAEPKRKLRA
jgi:DNA-binding GntR family transcriptional regulator